MKIRHFIIMSILVIGVMTGCKSNMNDVGRDNDMRNNAQDRADHTLEDVNRDLYGDERNINVRQVRNDNQQSNRNMNTNRQYTNRNDSINDTKSNVKQYRDHFNTAKNNMRDVKNQNGTNNNQSKMRVANRAADKITTLREVEMATVIVTENNAYVAAELSNDRDQLTKAIEKKIADSVKSVDGDIDNVYVSVNPELLDRFSGYANDISNGKPISGFFDEFTETIERIFPTNAK